MLETNTGTWPMCGDAPSGRVWGEAAGGWADSSLGLRVDDRSSWWATMPSLAKRTGNCSRKHCKISWKLPGDKISRMCSLGSASTSPGTQRPWQRDHPSWWPEAEREDPGLPAGLDPMWRGNLWVYVILLTTQRLASAALTARLTPQIVLAP